MKASIQTTAQPPVRVSINDWYRHIYKKVTENTVRPGGLNYSEKQEETLQEALEILNK